MSLRPLFKFTFATCLIAEFGFLGVIVTTRVTIPFAWGQRFNIDARPKEGFLYLGPGFLIGLFRLADCIQVAIIYINLYN